MKLFFLFQLFVLHCSKAPLRVWVWLMDGSTQLLSSEPLITNSLYAYAPLLSETYGHSLEKRMNVQLKMQSLIDPKLPSLESTKAVLTGVDKAAFVEKKNEIKTGAEVGIKTRIETGIKTERAASIDQLVAGIAHEINNPIGFVASNLDTLQEYAGSLKNILMQQQRLISSFSTQKTLSRIEIMALDIDSELNYILSDLDALIGESITGVGRVKKIVKDLSGAQYIHALETSEEDINKLLGDTLSLLSIHTTRGIGIVKEFDELCVTKVSGEKLQQAFLALINNAAQAVEDNGEVVLRTTQLKQHIRVDVIDNGCGIPEESLTTVFEPFYTTRCVGQGVGLGLHMAKKIAESHGGALRVSSKVGVGTVFTMILPIRDSNAHVSSWPMDVQA